MLWGIFIMLVFAYRGAGDYCELVVHVELNEIYCHGTFETKTGESRLFLSMKGKLLGQLKPKLFLKREDFRKHFWTSESNLSFSKEAVANKIGFYDSELVQCPKNLIIHVKFLEANSGQEKESKIESPLNKSFFFFFNGAMRNIKHRWASLTKVSCELSDFEFVIEDNALEFEVKESQPTLHLVLKLVYRDKTEMIANNHLWSTETGISDSLQLLR